MKGFRLMLGAIVWLLGAGASAHEVDDPVMRLKLKEPYLQRMDPVPAPGFVLEDAEGQKIGLADFRGRIVVLNFIYARCKEACPLQSELLAAVQKQINATPMRDRVQFVTVATDIEDARATARIMRGYGNAHGLDPLNWTFLYGGPGAPNAGITLAKAYGLDFIPTPDGEQIHGVVTHVIDQEGFLQARFHSLKFQPAHLARYLEVLLHQGHHARENGARTPGGGSLASGIADRVRAAAGSREPLAIGLIASGFFLLLVCWFVLRQFRARRKAGAQGSVRGGISATLRH